MEPIDLKPKYLSFARLANKKLARKLPYPHMIVVGALMLTLTLIVLVPSEDASASRESKTLSLPQLEELPEAAVAAQLQHNEPEAGHRSIKERVKTGDSLSTVFHRAGISDAAMFELIHSSTAAKNLGRLYPGHEFVFQLDEDGRLIELKHTIDQLQSQTFTRADDTFVHKMIDLQPDIKYALRSGTITSSLYNAGKEAQLDDELIMEMAAVFGWDIDFALDIRKGDSFKLLFEESFLDGERIGSGHILAAEFINQKTTFKAVRYVNAKGKAQYFTPDGKAMQKAFLRAPLDFRRISSNFNPKRLHPINKTVRPHRGTDYAASKGTPVWASGAGRVIASSYSAPNGNYVFIKHGGDITTKYLHLNSRKVKKGQKVRQKQIIGTVGSTGWSSGPHLHYEFLLNGVHRNPRTIIQKLPKAKSIAKSEMPKFFSATQPLLAELEHTTRYAMTNNNPVNRY